MYNSYFGLTESPFSIAPNPRYLYQSEQHQEALAHLMYGISSNGGFVLLTGEVGTGKTTVCRCLLEQLPDNTDVAVILNPKATVEELLAALCDELGIEYPQGEQVRSKTYIDLINRHLLETHARGRNTVLIIDEAQNLGATLLEQIRLLTNLETNECKLLQMVLVGQPELLELLARPELRQLSQRITARYHLGALPKKDLEAYIVHRLSVAGLDRPIFPARTLKRLYKLSGGIPRVVNILCDRALLGTFVQRDNRVEVATLIKAAREVFGDEAAVRLSGGDNRRWILGLSVAAGLLAWVIGFGVAAWVSDESRFDALKEFSLLSTDEAPPDQTAMPEVEPAVPEQSALASAAAMPERSEPANVTDSLPVEEPASAGALELALLTTGSEMAPAAANDIPGPFSWPQQSDSDLGMVYAYRSMFAAWHVEYDPRQNPVVCRFAESHGLGCLFSTGDLVSLQALNRPAVVSLRTGAGETVQAAVMSVNDEQALLMIDGKSVAVPYRELEQAWPGSYTLFWRLPPGYQAPIWPGSSGAAVEWLSQTMAQLEGGVQLMAHNTYDTRMVQQVRYFQMRQGLTVDGVVGPKTAIHLNTRTRQDLPLLSSEEL
ncbi:ATPase AAA [Marinobacterium nitratireducens]|uniref:ATPase AAA n=1 Tax=Marinobacterium nitratireducens TaxID=518897 RepID=A0A918DS18_9GAMM|nr:AAA family ATPase [Marinobacterium nitratireducens]GGO80100.1 ATPase AAA [Marinobacterium nitratireducens]